MGVSYLSVSAFCTVLSYVGLQCWMGISVEKLKSDGLIGESIINFGNESRALENLLGSHTTIALGANFAVNVFILLVLFLKRSAKYEGEDMGMTKEVTTPYAVSLWRSIRDMWDEVKSNARIKVVDGNKTRFWKDEWHEKGNLVFSQTYTTVLGQHNTIAEWTNQGWSFSFRRQFNDWEIEEWQNFSTMWKLLMGYKQGKMLCGGREIAEGNSKLTQPTS
ncbi:hypothetical protein MTR67_027249 [Solanum verrucosum]|uniref:Uncharacterized protein n=1 Tax=Solanum verrucosum TaxID=315347 RepID=A0AAF0TVJ1_SOLVR|nr:hypothetical protein MTR67_027249 [Solanum verrucosum]